MRVLFVTHYAHLYGANRSLLDIIVPLRERGVEPLVVIPSEGPMTDTLRQLAIPVSVIPFKSNVHRPRPMSLVRAIRKRICNHALASKHLQALQSKKVDIVHSNSSATYFGALLASRLRLPHVWHIRESLRDHYRMVHDFGARTFRRLLNRSARVVAISDFISQRILSSIPPERKCVVYNGVISADSLNRARSDWQPSSEKRDFTFAMVGRLEPGKHQIEAVQAVGQLVRGCKSKVRLVLAGDGSPKYVRLLERQIERDGLTSVVEFNGFLNDVTPLYQRADALLVCSRHEGLGRSTIEALAHGVPVIGYRGGGTREIVQDGENGLLYTGGPSELQQRMELLLENQELAAKLTQNARQSSLAQFTTEKCAESMFELFRQIVDGKGRAGNNLRQSAA